MLTRTITIYEERMVPIEKVVPYLDLMMRIKLPADAVEEYAAAMAAGSEFPPMDCGDVDGELLLSDGFIRHAAYRSLRISEVKVRIRKAECRDDVILWAVQANAHDHKRRTNADKQKSVEALLATDKYCDMPNTAVALAAGVSDETVRRYRAKVDKRIHNVDSNSSETVITKTGVRRPSTYNTKKKRKVKSKPIGSLPYQAINWPTAEERELPPPELLNEPHPDHPGFTYMQIHTRKHGFVQVMPVAAKVKQERERATRELIGRVRDIGAACIPLIEAMGKITAEDVVTTLEELDSRDLWMRKLNQHRAELDAAIPYIQALLNEIARPQDDADSVELVNVRRKIIALLAGRPRPSRDERTELAHEAAHGSIRPRQA